MRRSVTLSMQPDIFLPNFKRWWIFWDEDVCGRNSKKCNYPRSDEVITHPLKRRGTARFNVNN